MDCSGLEQQQTYLIHLNEGPVEIIQNSFSLDHILIFFALSCNWTAHSLGTTFSQVLATFNVLLQTTSK